MNDEKLITLTLAQLNEFGDESARFHVLQVLKEVQEWKDKGHDLQTYICLKQFLYTYSRN